MPEPEEQVKIGRTPAGQVATETPSYTAPSVTHWMYGRYGEWLGDPARRYGRLSSARAVPDWVKLEMMTDPVIAWCHAFVASALVRAERVVECADESKRLFFDAMLRMWESDVMLHAGMAVSLGHLGLIKKWSFMVPEPVTPGDAPVWTSSATPLIIRGVDPVYPVNSSPRFDETRTRFEGIDSPDGLIDVVYSLWLTSGKAMVFGDYLGRGRLEAAYYDWYIKRFARDQFTVRMIRMGDPVVMVRYPPGKDDDGVSHQTRALETGDAVRSMSTIAVPSSLWQTVDAIGEERYTGTYQWTVEYLEANPGTLDFVTLEGHLDGREALAMLVPPQAFLLVKQPELGGRTTADVLLEAAIELLMVDAAEIDRHLTAYVFAPVDRFNFPPGSPPVRVRTLGLAKDTRIQLAEFIKIMLGRLDVDPGGVVDLREALRRLDVPLILPMGDRSAMALAAGRGEPDETVPDDVLRDMVDARLPPPVALPVGISDEEIRRVLERLREEIPELFS